jgi:proline iminopeptidase
MPEVSINGTTLWYDVEGEGPPCLVVHGGLGVDHALYRATLGRLTERLRVVWYDQRGNGVSARPDLGTITMEQLADDASGLLDALDLGPAVVLGHSYGAFVAQELALRHPEAVRALVLAAAGPGQLGANEVEGEDGEGPEVPEGLARAFASPVTTDDEMREVFTAALPFYVSRFDPARLQEAFQQAVLSVSAMVRGFEVLATWSAVDRLGQIRVPTLVIGGRDDCVVSWPEQIRIAKRVPGSELEIFDDTAHFAWLDEPDGFWARVDGFLDRLE